MKKQLATTLLSFALILLTGIPVASATVGESAPRESVMASYLEDGFYLVTTLRIYASPVAPTGAVARVTGSKTIELYSDANIKQCSLTVEGTFSFDGRGSQALSASYSYTIDNMFWSFSEGTSYYESNIAYATATFNRIGILPTILNVSLSCSPDGVLS